MISVCGADGRLRPLRFRVEDEKSELHTLYVREIVDTRQTDFTGLEAFRFLCRAEDEGGEHLLELRYDVRAHRWALRRKLY